MNINGVRVDKGMALYHLKKLHDGRHVHQPMAVEHITPANIPKALLWAMEALNRQRGDWYMIPELYDFYEWLKAQGLLGTDTSGRGSWGMNYIFSAERGPLATGNQ